MRGASLILLFLLAFSVGYSQDVDSLNINVPSDVEKIETIETVSKLDPAKAALYSAVLPGLGQIYNKDYWKLPIVYGGGIIIGHFLSRNHQVYDAFRTALIAELDGAPNTVNQFERFNESSLQRNRDVARRNRDFLIIVGAAYYLLNVVEAHVSAHLKEFDVNEDLSMKINPSIKSLPGNYPAIGLGITLSLN